jgi:putative transposase
VQQPSALYKRHRFPGESISHAVWLYYPFLLSYRDVEELLAERGIAVSDETIRRWCRKFGPTFADRVRRRARPGDKWHLDEVQLKINGRKHWLWRAVDQDGTVLDILVQERRNQEAAETVLQRVLNGQGYQPRVVITDKLASYPPALKRVLPGVEHRRHTGLNNRAENSHRPTGSPAAENGCSSASNRRSTPSSSSVRSAPSPTTWPPPAPPPRARVPPAATGPLRHLARRHGTADRCLSTRRSRHRARGWPSSTPPRLS